MNTIDKPAFSTAREFAQWFKPGSGNRYPLIGGIGRQSVSGSRYCVASMEDGSAMFLFDGEVLDFSDTPVSDNVIETWAHAGRCLARYTQSERKAIIIEKYNGKQCVIDGVKWSPEGEYLGLNWSN